MIRVRQLVLGDGVPKICVPIVQRTESEILAIGKRAVLSSADCIEWRADYFEEHDRAGRLKEVLQSLRKQVGEMPIIFTIRTKAQGGRADILPGDYQNLYEAISEGSAADLMDVEDVLILEEERRQKFIESLKRKGVKTILSKHFVNSMPSEEEVWTFLEKGQEGAADILKLAVMPDSPEDVERFSVWMRSFAKRKDCKPLIALAMSEKGICSRVMPSLFASVLTFGYIQEASASGQIEFDALKRLLSIHDRSGMV